MAFVALLALVGLGWLWKKGLLGPDAGRKLAIVGGTILALWLTARGQMLPGLAVGGATAALAFARWMRGRVSARPMDEIAARQLLGVGLHATREEILAAHRRRIASVHPDRGTQDSGMAARVNAARDYLLARLPPLCRRP